MQADRERSTQCYFIYGISWMWGFRCDKVGLQIGYATRDLV